ncbi:hypothetical protein E8E13_002932 [Curvularia kusanoi]|uniref:Uncharacterized protein n=1 Tax=Curvularia kusanoi TaxID=90978 RepID=A0A9P4WB04_CURKU|nr:hypothetical protein E8E13_002932 [Curvularia kusanoi]
MSGVLVKALSPSPESRLGEAIDQFEGSLPEKHKSTFRTLRSQSLSTTPSPSDVMRLTAEVDDHTSKKFNSACFGPRFTNFLYGVQRFAALGDIVIGGSQNMVACGVWALVRMSLLSIVNLSTYIDKLSSLFMDVGRSAPRYQEIALLYPRSRKLRSYLNEYFIVVVGLCRYIFEFGQKSTVQQFVSSLSDAHLKTLQADLDKWASSIKEQMIVNEAQESDTGKVLDILFQGYSSDAKAYLIVDGLDECDEEEKETVVQALRKIQDKLKVLVCVSFRETNNGPKPVTNQLLATRNVPLPEDNPDIEAFIEAELERRLRQKRLTIGDPTLILNIQDALLRGSQGMFLWVTLQIQTLCTMKTDHAIRHALANLPKDLPETYTRILQRSGGGGSDLALQAKTLQLVLAARRPLTTEELREALSVIPGDATWDPSMVLNDVQSALACCGCLLAVDEEEFTVCFVHNSVKQYIVNGLYSVNNTGSSLKDAQRMLADVLVTYLNYGVFGTELSRARAHPILAQSAPSKIVQATMGSSSTAHQIAIKYLKTRRQPAVDMSRVIAEARSSLKFSTEHAFKFYAYAEKHWQDHVVYVSGQEAAIFKLTSKLVYRRASELNELDKSFWKRIQWAAENGNRNVVMLLIQAEKTDINATDKDGLTALMRAARDGYKDTVEVLLSLGNADVEARSNSKSTALMWAASNGHKEAVEVLLAVGKANVEAENNNRWTALMWAASNGHEETVEVLLRVGKAEVEARNNDGWTPLMWAASNGHEETVEVLLRVGEADVEAKDNGKSTALMWAASEGHRGTVEVLLRVGKADVEAKNNDGWTALMWAARDGHKKTVEVLLSLADVDAENNNRWTALMWAASKGHKDTVEVLLTVGKADVEAKNNEGWTALDLATRNKHEDTCELLQLYEMANRIPERQ